MPTQSNLVGSGCAPLQARASMGFPQAFTIASGTTQGSNPLGSDFNICTANITSGAVTLPSTGFIYQAGDVVYVVNHGTNALLVFPPSGGYNGNVLNASTSIPAGKVGTFMVVGTNSWSSSVGN